MKRISAILLLLACLVLTLSVMIWQQRTQQASRNITKKAIEPGTTEFARVAKIADQQVLQKGYLWGEPAEIRWQYRHDRYVVLYAMSESDWGVGRLRAVFVCADGKVLFIPGG